MNSIHKTFFVLIGLLFLSPVFTQKKLPEPWISYPSASVSNYGVYHFRKSFNLTEIPDKLVIHVSADNRYNLFVNGKRLAYGPAKGDLQTYKYDILDIAPFLVPGDNVIAALVYNAGKDKPMSIFSVQTAFMMRTENLEYSEINTDSSWKTLRNEAYTPVSYDEMLFQERWFYGFYACGPGDNIDAQKYPWGWERISYNDSDWKSSEELIFDGSAPWNLYPRNIPFMDEHIVYPASVREADGVIGVKGFMSGKERLDIPANSKSKVLFDYEILTMGYPELELSGGAGSTIKIKYAEALYEGVNVKAHRDSVNGKTMFGVWDVFHPDGPQRIFRPLWKRTFRYVLLEIETTAEALEILSFINEYSGYPYPEMSTFHSNDNELNEIFEIGLRTLRMCSGETYYDTPFYEQLSYGGDNRPIGALSNYNSTDDRLLREVMRLYPQSENKETGLFRSAYPSRFDFDQGTWSLAWIQSLHDYYFLRGDEEYVKQFAEKIEGVLGFYHRHIDETLNILGTVKNRNFIDWSISKGNIPRANENKEISHSTLLTLYYLHTLDCVIALYKEIGMQDHLGPWIRDADKIREAIYTQCYDTSLRLFRDYPDQDIYSQHSNILAILCNVISPDEQKVLMKRILEYKGFDELASSYFSFFLFKALQHTGMEDEFLTHLNFWKQFIERGLTTCGETGFASHDRSDCHAWAAHPSYYLLNIVCGIQSADIGFNNVKITPHLGSLTEIKASMPHPKGRIEVEYNVAKGKMKGRIVLPDGMNGTFEYEGKTVILNAGVNKI